MLSMLGSVLGSNITVKYSDEYDNYNRLCSR